MNTISEITEISLQTGILTEENHTTINHLLHTREHNDIELSALDTLMDALVSARVLREHTMHMSMSAN